MITYEHPFNERIRILLRLEDLFDKTNWFLAQEGFREHNAVLFTLFEILEVAGRADLKMDLIQELERQRQTLMSYRNNPAISEEALSGALYEIEQASTALLTMSGKLGQHLRDNEWLMSIKSRAHIPGGLCEFDIPSFHHWQNQASNARREALNAWIKPLLPLKDGINIVLRFLRASGHPEKHLALGGFFQQSLSGNNANIVTQMVRITIAKNLTFVPEVVANKYALNVRFSEPNIEHRPRHVEKEVEVPFEIAFCNL